ncbi:hypothetical protein AQUCO_05200011v1 [Aquilegia coerulea]|uniref:DYW domain-containing protein n=1 Tax=Aquilegia coerulea TaxID=218851 RepID=A0A2G5CIJ6_AQUCA|nr:hypothetical protein AQUCO_05200011v1 [Aquilegia coerulea]
MVHGYAVRSKLELDLFIGNALIDMYANCGDLGCSRRVFDLMTERDVVTWTAMVSAYMDFGYIDEAMKLFDSMQLNGVKPDVISWNALVSGFAHNGEIDEALRLLDEMRETGLKPGVNSWNGVISGCVQNEFFEDAIDVFGHMMCSNENPNAVTFACILPACGAMGDLRLGKSMHTCALKRDLLGNIFVKGSLIGMYVNCWRRDLAERVFMEMEVKNTAVMNEMIMAYVNEGNTVEASVLLNSMLTGGLKPDVITYNTLLSGLARKGQKEEAFRLLSDMIQMGLKPNVISVNAVISGFQQCGLTRKALKLFRIMQSPSGIINMVMDDSKACRCFSNQSSTLSIKPDSVTTTSALAACADLNLLCHGREIHGYILSNGLEPNIFVSSALVDMYAKCHDLNSAVKVFYKIEDKNTVSWNTLMAGLTNNTEAEEALNLFPKMLGDGHEPSSITFMILLSACGYVASLRLGKELHGYILKSGLESTAAFSSALIDMYAKCGSIIEARLVFDCEAQKDIIVWNALISGYSIHGMAKEAVDVFEHLKSMGVDPDHTTFTALLSAFTREGMLEQGWKYFNCMETFGIKHNLDHYTCMVRLVGSAGFLKEALDIIERMPHAPDACIWATLLKACEIYSNSEIGERAAKALFELEPSKAPCIILFTNTFSMDELWQSSTNLNRGCSLSSVKECSSIDVGHTIYTFKEGKSLNPKLKEIMDLWRQLASAMQHLKYLPLDPVFEDNDNLNLLSCSHTEKLAICFGLMTLDAKFPIRISKNLLMCIDCHTSVKHISRIKGREIFVKDGGFYHRFKDGRCSCNDRW